jgi:ubiquinone/menaquinone biosynthesis C-methylase UbiE
MTPIAEDARFWDRIARKYAADKIKDPEGYERTLGRTGPYLKTTDTVLELGCGTGTTALRLAPRVQRLVATDLSREMIAIAREKASAQGCANVEFAVAPADGTPQHDTAFDAVLAFNVLHLVGDSEAVIARAAQVLKPGGLFISKTPCIAEMHPLIRFAVPIARFIGKAPHVSFFAAPALESAIEAAGFTILERARHGSKRKDPRIFIVAQKRLPG